YASALAWVLFVVILIITLIQVRLSSRFVYYEGE
ncbi:MAG TPA: sugar ABC transporter permease, partial [Candidatus Limnocylindria bacterium]|nr:sugar ABC transporter permease [Candidatus Limnocylindria bacterium]